MAGPDVGPGGRPPGPHPRGRRRDAHPLWIALFFISAIVLAYPFGFADSAERAWVQAVFMGSVVAVIVTVLLLLVNFLEDPFHGGVGGLQLVAMDRTELLIDQQIAVIGGDITIPCAAEGTPA